MSDRKTELIKNYLPTYTILIWNDIMRIKRLANQDPFKAYNELKFLIPLLPEDIKDDIMPLFTKFEKKLKDLKESLYYSLKDYISTKYTFNREAKKLKKYFIFKVLDVICDKLEKKKLMYQYDLIRTGGEE
jgi:hypothetical protein